MLLYMVINGDATDLQVDGRVNEEQKRNNIKNATSTQAINKFNVILWSNTKNKTPHIPNNNTEYTSI